MQHHRLYTNDLKKMIYVKFLLTHDLSLKNGEFDVLVLKIVFSYVNKKELAFYSNGMNF